MSDVTGYNEDDRLTDVRTRINKKPLDIMRDIFAQQCTLPVGHKLLLRANGEHIAMLNKIVKILCRHNVQLLNSCTILPIGQLSMDIIINSVIPIETIFGRVITAKEAEPTQQ